ncbi:hypothetical protein HBH56_134320 [Parastagonospora nodorum]|uniref:NB-ARC domain-containing protein n=1 Tax=Phaeosphaeria nodorum (strain SN15 / ATCC MYA-4574 / FGSC 10173) TaxID=321614 RepID=A0A7U2FED3_PHANO|nr:hypothetical protein HBH56_134320 [Parastagonospora nodorum]QRD02679.1 hypothetical protein JI435_114150 [Parastagonospora nodorum SN15]KAH3927052.1 hypothetical protein HBH54_158970 [Parastagonospora nodorum]KAH3949256.1 hypothetical protein HBH53_089380 [Parastagonospora nodorum]KAH4066786.1 hypothetical protein HBH50_143000 [Parastagonospora nodorum]
MAEWIGVAAAIPQLAKYSLTATNAVPDFVRRVRKAPITQNQWADQASLLASLSQEVHKQRVDNTAVASSILGQLDDDLNKILPFLRRTKIDAADGRLARLKKRIRIVNRETEMVKELANFAQRSTLCSQLAILRYINSTTATKHADSAQSSTLGSSYSQSSTVAPSLPGHHDMLIRKRNPNFVGQGSVLHQLFTKIENSSSSTIALCGLGGAGKTEVALELAYMLRDAQPNTTIRWLDASMEPSLCEDPAQFGQHHIDAQIDLDDKQDVATVLSSQNSAASGLKLLVLDNADIATCSASGMQSLLTQQQGIHILITTRNRRFALDHFHPVDLFEMPVMTLRDGRDLLLSYAGLSNAGNSESIGQLVNCLDMNPFALKQIGLYMKCTGNGVEGCLPSAERGPAFLTMLLMQKHDCSRGSAACTAMFDWMYSFRTLAAENVDVLSMLFELSCIHNIGICEEITAMLVDTESKRHALDILKSYSLLVPVSSDGTWMMPNIVGFATKAHLVHHRDRIRILEGALQLVTSFVSSDSVLTSTAHRCWAHVASVLGVYVDIASETELESNTISAMGVLALRLCHHLVAMGRAREAILILNRLIIWASNRSKDLIPLFDRLRGKLGMALHGSGQYAAAELETRQVLRSQILTIGEDDINTIHSLNNLGVYHQDQGRFPMAESFHRKAFDMKRAKFGAHHLETLLTLNNLALSLQSQKKYNESELFLGQALRGRKRLLSATHPDTLVCLSNFAVLKQLQGHFEQSQLLQEAALSGREQMLGSNHPETLKSKGNLALLLQLRGRHGQAVDLLSEACQVYKDTIGRLHPETIKSIRNLAIILHQQNKFAEAQTVAFELQEILEEKHGKGHPETFASLDHLATILHWQGKLEDAFEIIAWLHDIRSGLLGKDHPDTISSRNYLSSLEAELASSEQASSVLLDMF